MSERYTIRVLDTPYTVVTEESVERMEQVAAMVDRTMRDLLDRNQRASITMAAIFTAIQFCGEKLKAEETAGNLRVQMKSYLEDNNRMRSEQEELRKKATQLELELARIGKRGDT